jgi:FtsP/CotA-like multicopper oxidase with cupredoxin domain
MFMILYITNMLSSVLLMIASGFVTNRLGRLSFRSTKEALFRSIKRANILLFVTFILLLIKLTIVSIIIISYGWMFVNDQQLLALPLILISFTALFILTYPILRNTRKEGTIHLEEARNLFSSATFFVPVQSLFISTVLNTYFTIFQYPFTLNWLTMICVWLLFAVMVIALWFRQERRNKNLDQWNVNQRFGRIRRAIPITLVTSILTAGWFSYTAYASVLPDKYSMADHHSVDWGDESQPTNSHHSHQSSNESSVSVTALRGPQNIKADKQITLVAKKERVRLQSGKTIEAWTFNGSIPGPEIRVKQGDLVEVILKNKDIKDGVTIHWHGYNVPNGEDGVAGVTQNSIQPGEQFVYRFRAEQTGTYWYHSHQQSSKQVSKGLFGSFIVEPKKELPNKEKDITIVNHEWDLENESNTIATFGRNDQLSKHIIQSGTPVRLRLINSSNNARYFQLSGTSFQVDAIDGNKINQPSKISNQKMLIAAGGRYDLIFKMPNKPVSLISEGKYGGTKVQQLFHPPNTSAPAPAVPVEELPTFDPAHYGKTTKTSMHNKQFDREFKMILGNRIGFYDGKLTPVYTINGKIAPYTPMLMVRKGDIVKTTFVNEGVEDHPMHLHGHHMLVLSRNGKPITGNPWYTDTLNVGPGEKYEVTFAADNPGIWMDHCHNLTHAEVGMTLHLSYQGITTPFKAGSATLNQPE